MIIANDPRVDEALKSASEGNFNPLQQVLSQAGKDRPRHSSIDLVADLGLEGLDLNYFAMGGSLPKGGGLGGSGGAGSTAGAGTAGAGGLGMGNAGGRGSNLGAKTTAAQAAGRAPELRISPEMATTTHPPSLLTAATEMHSSSSTTICLTT